MRNRRGMGRSLVALAAVTGMAAACTAGETGTGPEPPNPPGSSPGQETVALDDARLVSFDSCDDLLEWFQTEAGERVGPYGLDSRFGNEQAVGGFAEDSRGSRAAASPPTTGASSSGGDESSAGPGTSTTNTQEPGIGEPDVAWTDGTRVATVVNGGLQVVDLPSATVTADLDLSTSDSSYRPVGLLVDGDHALVIQQSNFGDVYYGEGFRGDSGGETGSVTTALTRVDLGKEATVVGTTTVTGQYVDARMVGGVVRVVVRSSPTRLGFVYPSGANQVALDRARTVNRQVIEESTVDDWLPDVTVSVDGREGTSRQAVDCAAVGRPEVFSGFDVVSVVGLDLAAGAVEPLPSAAVVADAETVYASSDHLYVATTQWQQPGDIPTGPSDDTSTSSSIVADPGEQRTAVHSFSLPAGVTAAYEASGSVAGHLLGQFALSELDGDLRVASTTTPVFSRVPVEPFDAESQAAESRRAPESESRITVLRQDGEQLAEVGQVTGLGPTEQIFGVRFAGSQAYVVTFRQTDPLFVVDLSDPTAPAVAGQLKIPGYSSYLQVIGEGRVLGIGQDASDTGRTTGFQESLFDVSDPSNPQRIAHFVVPNGQSLAEQDHHALLWWAPDQLLAVPLSSWVEGRPQSGVLVTTVDDGGITENGTITHPTGDGGGVICPPDANCVMPVEPGPGDGSITLIQRTMVADGRLVTVSSAGVKVTDMATLADVSWTSLG